jgi:hypothetical protein
MEKSYILMHGRVNLDTKRGNADWGSFDLMKPREDGGWDESEEYCGLFRNIDSGKYRIIRGAHLGEGEELGKREECYHDQSRRFMGYFEIVDIKKIKDMHEWKELVGGYTLPCGCYK